MTNSGNNGRGGTNAHRVFGSAFGRASLGKPAQRDSFDEGRWVVGDGRGNLIEVDPEAFHHNLAATRALLPTGTRVYQVVKGEGYGFGLDTAVSLGLSAAVDGFCAGTPGEALRIREAAGDAFVLLFTASPPSTLPALALAGVTVTLNSLDAFEALLATGSSASVFVELECGFGRFGLDAEDMDQLLLRYGAQERIRIVGAYTHFGRSDPGILDQGLASYDQAVSSLRRRLGHPFETMVASSHTILDRPDLPYDAVDPGRLLYGIVDPEQRRRFRPVLSRLGSTLLQLHAHHDERRMQIGYGDAVTLPSGSVTGVFPLGWYDGLPVRGPLGEVVVNGCRARVVARTLLHSIVDLSGVPGAKVGDRVTLVEEVETGSLPAEEVATAMGISVTELHLAVAGAITAPRRSTPAHGSAGAILQE